MGWAEKPLLKGTVSPCFQHCGIAVDSPEEKTTNKSTLQSAFRFSETELRTASEAKRAKHKQHQIPSLPCTKAKQRHSFHVAGWGFPCWPFTIVIRNLSFWYKGQQRAELVSTLVRRVFLDWRHLIGRWWVTDAEVHRQKHLIGCPPVSAFQPPSCDEWCRGSKSYHLDQLRWWEGVRGTTFTYIPNLIAISAASLPHCLLKDAFFFLK